MFCADYLYDPAGSPDEKQDKPGDGTENSVLYALLEGQVCHCNLGLLNLMCGRYFIMWDGS